ncbi:TatD family hydrolase [Cellulomonas sp. Sa3CUA2]|uniref:TatD family hydrolase n=1 Tax=Cellulomonas avistercoris TaxID=2762242 RepID=A0ABR8QEA5_9CELL|nr:TatD family hydrolase [Cellulomonas avistercoris]MBD7918624.1 TatD family hydrolase [Cellulomonas avistercoris]
MTVQLPPIDLHAHISPKVSHAELERLGAVVFAATRSIAEFESVRNRRDTVTVWGLGCHPGVERAQTAFDPAEFTKLLPMTAYVSEVGIDGRSRVAIDTQVRVLTSILESLQRAPRITSIHSSGAPSIVLKILEEHRVQGAVLHWWRGDTKETRRALELGCWFSFNAAGMKHPADVAAIPLDRVLTETDHPTGDRGSTSPRQPGAVGDVETALAQLHGLDAAAVRRQVWSNFASLVHAVDVVELLPLPVRRMLAATERPDPSPRS